MPNKSLSRSGLLTYQKYSSLLAGNDPFSPSAYDLLETVTLGSDAASASFTSLNSTYGSDYKHLQIRAAVRGTRANDIDGLRMQISGDTGTNYRRHKLQGDGSSVSSSTLANQNHVDIGAAAAADEASGNFSPFVVDLLDAFDSSKNTTVRGLSGALTTTGSARTLIQLNSGLHLDTSAITQLTFLTTNNIASGSRFSLYGLKASA